MLVDRVLFPGPLMTRGDEKQSGKVSKDVAARDSKLRVVISRRLAVVANQSLLKESASLFQSPWSARGHGHKEALARGDSK
jgi:hypothetical protein